MKKNDITYEYRVFTHRSIDVESMEVGICTSKIVKELKEKDKVDGRFFHTTDSDEWFFCWDGNLQKLNLKGDADVNAALEEVNRLIAEANVAVEAAKKTASEAKDAADSATAAAKDATDAVESIGKLEDAVASKADKGDVEAVANVVKTKQDAISDLSEIRTNANLAKTALQEVPKEYITEGELAGMNYATTTQVNAKQDIISDLATIRSGAAAGATALQSIPDEYITETELNGKGFATTEYVGQQIANIEIPTVPTKVSEFTNDAEYLNKSEADKLYAPIGSASDGSGSYATQDFVRGEIAKIEIPTVPTNVSAFTNDAGYLTEHQDISHLATKAELPTVPTKVSELENDSNFITLSDVPEVTVPTKTSELTNDSGFITINDVPVLEIPEEYITEEELNQKGYLTEHQSLSDYYTKGEINDMIGSINDLIGEATALTNTILNA
jgi:hypothetical protein